MYSTKAVKEINTFTRTLVFVQVIRGYFQTVAGSGIIYGNYFDTDNDERPFQTRPL